MMKKEDKRFLRVKTAAAYKKVYAPICCRFTGERNGSVFAFGCIAIDGKAHPLPFKRESCDGEML